ncbi:MAG TPA: hypothetical protein ENK16_08030 [Chromatiales bacterium]|nr:hypothetical protein [Chromatiales bacterium]
MAAVLILVQTGVLMHTLQHGAVGPQDQNCSICLTAHSAASACIDTSIESVTPVIREHFIPTHNPVPVFARATTPQQRAPPVLL